MPDRRGRKYYTPEEAAEARRKVVRKCQQNRRLREARCSVDINGSLAENLEAFAMSSGRQKKEIVASALETFFRSQNLIP